MLRNSYNCYSGFRAYENFHSCHGDYIGNTVNKINIDFGNYQPMSFGQGFRASLGFMTGGFLSGLLGNILPQFGCNLMSTFPTFGMNYGNYGNGIGTGYGNNSCNCNCNCGTTRSEGSDVNNYLDPDNKKIADLIERVSNINAETPTENVNKIKSDIEKAIEDLDNVNKPADKKSLECLKKLLDKLNNPSAAAPVAVAAPPPAAATTPQNDNATTIQNAQNLDELNDINYDELSDEDKTKFKDKAIELAKKDNTTPEKLRSFLDGLDNEDLRKAIKESFYESGYTNVDKDKVKKDLLEKIQEIIDKSDVTDLTNISISEATNSQFKATSNNDSRYNSTYTMQPEVIDGEVIFKSKNGQYYVLQQKDDNYYLMQYKYHTGFGKEDIKLNS